MPSYRSQFYGEEIDERLGKIPQMESDIEHLKTNGGINEEEVKKVVDTALEEAKVSGEFNGEDGFSPVVEVTRYSDTVTGKSGMTVTVQNKDGTFNSASVEDGKDGTNGKSAYEYAVDGGFEGTEEDFIKLLADGEIYIGTEEPTDPNIKIWVKTDGTKPNISLFENDVGYITAKDVPEAPQADWSQNDETAADYIKNRTHWVEPTDIIAVEEQTVLLSDDDYYETTNISESTFVKADKYEVTYNGTTYKYTAFEISGGVFIGNLGLAGMGEDDGTPFLGAITDGVLMFYGDGSETVTIKIIHKSELVHQLPNKFIRNKFEISVSYQDGQYILNTLFDDIKAAYIEGKEIYAVLSDLVNNDDGSTVVAKEIFMLNMCAITGDGYAFWLFSFNHSSWKIATMRIFGDGIIEVSNAFIS